MRLNGDDGRFPWFARWSTGRQVSGVEVERVLGESSFHHDARAVHANAPKLLADNAPGDDVEFLFPCAANASCLVLTMHVDHISRCEPFFK